VTTVNNNKNNHCILKLSW